MERNTCTQCGAPIKGRVDKKYCSTKCKNDYNYLHRQTNDIVKTIDNILHKNHRIMTQLFKDEKRKHFKVQKVFLSKMGFDFSYYTGTYLNSANKRYYYIYNFAWMEFSKQEIMVVQNKSVSRT